MKAPGCLAILLLLAGCTANPFVNRAIETESGESVRYPFAYGRYCGPGRPSSSDPDTPIDLFDFWPPVDDIDVMCFAHDYCLQATNRPDNECDYAMWRTTAHFRQLFPQQACYNLSSDISRVMQELSASPWPSRKLRKAIAIMNVSIYDPFVTATTRKTDEYPDEGACRMVTESSATMVLDAFEYFFPGDIEIPRDRVH